MDPKTDAPAIAETTDDEGFTYTSTSSQADLQAAVDEDAKGREQAEESPDPKPEAKPEAKPETKPEGKADPKPEGKPDQRTPKGRLEALTAQIAQLTREKHTNRLESEQAKAETEALRREAAELKADIEAAKAARAAKEKPDGEKPGEKAGDKPDAKAGARAPEPDEDDFEDFREWVKAHAAWTRDQAKLDAEEVLSTREKAGKEREAETAQRETEAQRAAYQRELAAKHAERLDSYGKSHPDFATLMESAGALPTNPMIDAHILHSEFGPQFMRYLAEHPDECEEIAALPPGPTLIRLGKIEASFEKAKGSVKSGSAPQRPAVTRARPPVSPVGGGGEVVDGEDAEEPLDGEFGPDYVRRMNERDRARARSQRL